MKCRLTILCENSVGGTFGVVGEHGFACFVETEAGNYLFDTGQGFGIVRNALALRRDLSTIRAIAISHGHYDHTGGLPQVLALRGPVDVFGHPDLFLERVRSTSGKLRFIGIPYRRGYLESMGAHFRLETRWVEIGPGVHLTGDVPRLSAFEKGDPDMIVIHPDGRRRQPDPIADDLSLVLDGDKGLIVVLGCAHAGTINIIDHVLKTMNRDRIHAVIGGTHLGFCTDGQFDATLERMERIEIDKIGVSHCTGPARAAQMHARFKERFFFGSVGAGLEG